jgi:hypothetical protein
MSENDSQRAIAMRRIFESVAASVTGGLILWWLTATTSPSVSPLPSALVSQSAIMPQSTTELANFRTNGNGTVPLIQGPTETPDGSQTMISSAPPVQATDQRMALSIPAAAPASPAISEPTADLPSLHAGRTGIAPRILGVKSVSVAPTSAPAASLAPPLLAAMPAPPASLAPKSPVPAVVPLGSILLYENFSRYMEGDVTDWGHDAVVKVGLDGRKWLAPYMDGAHPVGRTMPLPSQFYLEWRYSAYVPESTRGLWGWWKEPITSRIALVAQQGTGYVIQWTLGYGERVRLNPLVPPPANKYYHTITLPGAAPSEITVGEPTGTLRITRNGKIINVLVNGQLVAAGMIGEADQLVGFEVDVVKARCGILSFTDFKVGR